HIALVVQRTVDRAAGHAADFCDLIDGNRQFDTPRFGKWGGTFPICGDFILSYRKEEVHNVYRKLLYIKLCSFTATKNFTPDGRRTRFYGKWRFAAEMQLQTE